MPAVTEAQQTLISSGVYSKLFADVGVAGLWRIQKHLTEIKKYKIIIVAAGMDGALVSVLGGLISQPIIAVPTSTGYGVSNNGKTALNAMLASCSPGITLVNIDNGYGAATAAIRILNAI
jgi:NCAIR mutase (PurE)-related protein